MQASLVAAARRVAVKSAVMESPVARTCVKSSVAASPVLMRGVHTEAKLENLGHTLPQVAAPKGSYQLCVRSGNTMFTAGHLPQPANGDLLVGKVGVDLSVEEANKAAQYCALSILATLKAELGDLDRIARVVKVVGFVNCADGFAQQPQVINGASDLFAEVLGDRGLHARSAVGTNALPLNVPVEVEAIVEVSE